MLSLGLVCLLRSGKVGAWRYRTTVIRPNVEKRGDLVQVDAIHLLRPDGRVYVFTLLDVYSRWAYARASPHAHTTTALRIVQRAQRLVVS
jgi:hypothetical protein